MSVMRSPAWGFQQDEHLCIHAPIVGVHIWDIEPATAEVAHQVHQRTYVRIVQSVFSCVQAETAASHGLLPSPAQLLANAAIAASRCSSPKAPERPN
jgi:hypothetical protein